MFYGDGVEVYLHEMVAVVPREQINERLLRGARSPAAVTMVP
jgi:hypothetical protein